MLRIDKVVFCGRIYRVLKSQTDNRCMFIGILYRNQHVYA